MDEEARRRLEYEEQFYGMSSTFFADSFKNFVKDQMDSTITLLVENFKKKIINQSKEPEKFEEGIKEMKKNLTDEYYNGLDESFPEIQSKISDIIQIPPNVILKEDLPVKEGVGKDLNKIKEEVDDLVGTYKSLLYMKQEMLEELQEANSAIFFMECIINKNKVDFEVLPVEEISALSKANNQLVTEES